MLFKASSVLAGEIPRVLCGGNYQFLCQAKVHADITFSSCFIMSSPVLEIFAVIYCEVNVPCLVGE